MDLVSVGFLLMFSRKPLLLFGASGTVLSGLGVLVAAVAIYLRFVHPILGFDPYIPPMGYRPLLYLVMLLETLGFLLVGFGLVSEQIAQVRDEIEALKKKDRPHSSEHVERPEDEAS
jgi:ABC-type nitrate/sulfonate/bicarbonate transport system permease component